MARRTKQQAGEIVETIYGINGNTYEVESISVTRGGTMTRWNENGPYSYEAAGRNPRNEAVVVFGLSEIRSVSQVLFGSDAEKRIMEELKAKAEALKR